MSWGIWGSKDGSESYCGGMTEEEARAMVSDFDPDDEAYAAEECPEHPDYERIYCEICNADEAEGSEEEVQ